MKLVLDDGECIYTGIYEESKKDEEYMAVFFLNKSRDQLGGYPTKAAKIVDLLNIPSEPHWLSNWAFAGWGASHFVRVQLYHDAASLPVVSPKVTAFLSQEIKNESALFVLRK